ncbi:MAG: protein kinase [Planctomycetota bacterium]
MSDSWARVVDVFTRARALAPSEREALLAELPPNAAREVLSLLAADESAGDFLEESPSTGTAPARVGPFRLHRRIARGGMGVVYEAEQDRPQRRIALKLLTSPWPSQKERLRFEHEAEILASLEHPSIARVYSAGTATDDRGADLPFIAMELVLGARSIVAFARARLLPRRQRLQLFLEACSAIEHAHRKGILHRDIKPENLLVDAEGQLKVIDFGIARPIDADSELTRTGELMGTLRYLSPEQAEGRRPDVRSDVYALGLVLYELLLDRPAFSAQGSVSAVLNQTRTVIPPIGSGELDVQLTTVLRVALAKDPEDRHASVGVLREDIERIITNRPILSRQPSRLRRARLWIRRHRAVAAAMGLVAVTSVAATFVSIGFALETEQARQAEVRRSRREAAARQSLEDAYQRSRELSSWVLRDLYAAMERIPGTLSAREQLVERFREHLDELSVSHAPSRIELARAWSRLGDLLGGGSPSHLGRTEEALASYQRSIELYRTLAALEQPDVSLELVNVELHLASLQLEAGQAEAAVSTLELASESLARDWPQHLSAEARLAQVDHARIEARLAAATGSIVEAGQALQRALDIAETLVTGRRGEAPYAMKLAAVNIELAVLLANRLPRAREHFERFLEIVSALPAPAEDDLAARHDRAHYHVLAADFIVSHDLEEAFERYSSAMELRKPLVAAAPEDAGTLRRLTIAEERAGSVLIRLGRSEEAIELLRPCLERRRQLLEKDPTNRERQFELAVVHQDLGEAYVALGKRARAREHLLEAVERFSAIRQEAGAYPAARSRLSAAAESLGDLLGESNALNQVTAAQHWYRESRTQIEVLQQAGNCTEVDTKRLERLDAKLSTASVLTEDTD